MPVSPSNETSKYFEKFMLLVCSVASADVMLVILLNFMCVCLYRLGPTEVECTSNDRGTCICGVCNCRTDSTVSKIGLVLILVLF